MPAALALLAALACALATAASAADAGAGPAAGGFDGARAIEHLRALAGLGPRVAGTPGAAAARDYVAGELASLGYDVEEETTTILLDDGGELAITNLRAVAWGSSEDVLVLGAPLDTPRLESFDFVGANEGASGAALLLELARVLRERPLPYTVWLVFFDGESVGDQLLGSRAFARELRQSGDLERLRLAVYFHQVGDRDLAIARDVGSDRAMRRIFFDAARRLGHEAAFPTDRPFAALRAGHLALPSVGFRRVVLVMDDRFGGDEPPGAYHRSAEDTPERCAPESLAVVGEVSLAALRDAAALFAEVDRRAGPRERVVAEESPLPDAELSADSAAAADPEGDPEPEPQAAGDAAGTPPQSEPVAAEAAEAAHP